MPEVPKLLQELPPNWWENSGYQANYKQLANWLANLLTLGVPSAVVKESFNYLLHPKHPNFTRIEIVTISPFNIDPRLWHDRNA